MIGFASPAWLLGLLLAPVIWYVHRSGPLLRRVPVANLDLWHDAAASAATAGQRKRADPAWRRRAAIAVLLSLALAGPQWTRQAPRVTVWIDDSLSMRAADATGTRLEQGVTQAQRALRDVAASDVIVRSLGDPSRHFRGLDNATLTALLEQPVIQEPRLPPPEVLDASRSHWLVTDGADAAVNAWVATAPIERVLQIMGPTRNVGITRLSARPLLDPANRLAVQVRLLNGGDTNESRTVELFAGATRVGASSVTLGAGVATVLEVTVAVAAPRVSARLLDGDALVEDDVLELDITPLEREPVAVDPACGPTIARAVRAHPALRMAPVSTARLSIDCDGGIATDTTARVRMVRGTPTVIDRDALLWPASAEPLRRRIGAQLPHRARGVIAVAADDVTLLAAGTAPLIVLRGSMPRTVETSLDLETASFASSSGAPLVLAALVDIAVDDELFDRIASVDRGNDASRIVPTGPSQGPRPVAPARPFVAVSMLPLLLVALALFTWDLLALARRLLRKHTEPRGVVP